MIMRITLIIIILAALTFGAYQPPPAHDPCKDLFDFIKAPQAYKGAAVRELVNACEEFGVDTGKMVSVIWIESEGKINAYNRRTEARGLCQVTEQAIQDLPFGYRYYTHTTNGMMLNKRYVYSAEGNIRAGVAYMAMCERRAPGEWKRLPHELKKKVTIEKMSVLLYCWGIGNYREFLNALKYAETF